MSLLVRRHSQETSAYPGFRAYSDIREKHRDTDSLEGDIKKLCQHFGMSSSPDQIDRLLAKTHKVTKRFTGVTLYSPDNASLEKIAAHYKEKYGVDIFVKKTEELKAFIVEKQQEAQGQVFGVVVSQNDEDLRHVATLLVYVRDDGVLEFILMDSTGRPESEPASTVQDELGPLNGLWLLDKGKRQLDNHSCRTESTVLLRNALLYIQDFKETREFTSLMSLKLKTQKTPNQDIRTVTLPSQWVYTKQRFFEIPEKDLDLPIIRDKFSKNPVKKENPKTIKGFLKDNVSKISTEITFEIQSTPEKPKRSKMPKAQLGDIVSNTTMMCDTETSTYLTHKGRKFAERFSVAS